MPLTLQVCFDTVNLDRQKQCSHTEMQQMHVHLHMSVGN